MNTEADTCRKYVVPNHSTQPTISKGRIQMNEYELDENSNAQFCPSDDNSDNNYSLECRIASQSQYYGRWAAEKWLLRLYFYRCCRFLRSRFRPEKPVDNTPDELPF
jgi:hypothetical protein